MMFYPILAIASPAAEGAEEVYIPDPGLEAAIREAIDKLYGPIYVKDLEGLTTLDAPERGIANLTGVEYCTDLESLYLSSNKITDLSPLSYLVNLKKLYLSSNKITDLSPLSHLINLKGLDLWSNKITDIAPLVLDSGLSEGDTVELTDNPLSETSIKVYIPQLERRGVAVNPNLPLNVKIKAKKGI